MNLIAKMLLVCLPLGLSAQQSSLKNLSPRQLNQGILFTENRGQVANLEGIPQPQVLFTANNAGVKLFISSSGIHYQFIRIFEKGDRNPKFARIPIKDADSIQILRLDMKLIGAQIPNQVIRDGSVTGVENFYLAHCPQGITNVKQYNRITFKNVYPGIDWILYDNNGMLEYDFSLQPGADITRIQMQYSGADNLSIEKDGSLLLKTALGTVKEQSPVSFQGNEKVNSSFTLNENLVGFTAKYNTALPLRIDPNIVWATYYGGSSFEEGHATAVDKTGSVYLAGDTYSTNGIASSGGLQTVLRGFRDAFIAKFNTAGQRTWATYYGGVGYESALSCATDKNNNIYVIGNTNSSGGISTAGSHQPALGGINDAYLLKLNSNGQRQWATYYGGSKDETGFSCAVDTTSNVYITGRTNSTNRIASGGAQNSFGGNVDAFLAKFNTNGVRQWGTYYGGSALDYGYSCAAESNGTVYLTGTSTSSSGIATSGSFQTTRRGASDAFLVKFSTAGVRQWGTYFGGDSVEDGSGCCIDLTGNVFITGNTESATNLAVGGFSTVYDASGDAFLAEFNSAGARQWSTYYGGDGFDAAHSCMADSVGNVTITGSTFSANGIAAGGFQSNLSGDGDCFAAKFSNTGLRIWGTYYGGNRIDYGSSVALGSVGNIYIAGYTTSSNNVASGGYQNSLHGFSDAFLLRINDRAVSNISFYNQFNSSYSPILLDTTTTDNNTPSPIRVAADGSKATYVNYYNKDANVLINNISFRIKEDINGVNKDVFGFMDTAFNASVAPQIRRCFYNHPTFLNNGSLFRNLTIQILDVSTNTILEEYPLQVYKAPLLLVHGLYGNAESFKSFEKDYLFASGANLYPGTPQNSPFLLRAEYNYADGVVKNNSVMKMSIDRLLQQMVNQKYSAGKVDIIAHSMGGLISRAYIQDPYNIQPYRNDVHKLITLNTMHAGSQLSDCISNPNSDCALWALIQHYIKTNSPTVPTGMGELGTQSEVIDSLLNSYTVAKNNLVPTASVSTTVTTLIKGPSEPCAGAGIATQNLNIFNGETNDKMVALSSQQGNILPAKGIFTSCHENAVNNSNVYSQMGTLINQNPNVTNFDIDGYIPTALTYTPITVPNSAGIQTVSINTPAHGAVVRPGQVISVTATGSTLTKRMELYIGNEYVNTTAHDTTGKNINYSFTIPNGTTGVLRMIAIGRDSVNAFKYDTLSVRVLPLAVLDSVRTYPQRIIVPEFMRASFEVYGYYNDGAVRTLSSMPDVSYTINNASVAGLTTGAEIEGIIADTTSVLISYLGKSHRTPIEVIVGKDYQRAAFFVNDTLLCPGTTGRFTNTSTGNPVSYSWAFEGGLPATSTQANPVITYSANGKYDVELITTFAGGIKDTLKIKDYIVVGGSVPNNPASITVTSGKTKVCPADTTTYTSSTVFNATSYLWVAPVGGTVVSGQGTNTARIAYGAGFINDDSLRVASVNKCGTSSFKAISVRRNDPATPSVITGQKDGVCALTNALYTVGFVDSIYFNWRYVFGGATIVTGQGTNNMSANYTSSIGLDTLKVSAMNTCGTSIERALIIRGTTVAPLILTGPVTVCANQTNVAYSCDAVQGATSYTWLAPSGSRITDGVTTSTTNSFTTTSRNVWINFATTSGNVSVRGNNNCGSGISKLQAVTVNTCFAATAGTFGSNMKATVYPNPAAGNAFVKISNITGDVVVRVADMSGHIIWESMRSANRNIEIPARQFAPGTYMIIIQNNSETITRKLLKTN